MRCLGVLSGLMVLILSVSAFAAELVDNPSYKSWAKFKPGTSIVYSQNADMGAMKMTMEMTQTLTELTPDNAVVEMSMTNSMMPGNPQKQTTKIPAKIESDKVVQPGAMPPGMKGETKSLGNEKVTVGDKEYDCAVTQFSGENAGMKTEGKAWTNPSVPGSLIKTEMKGTGDQGAMSTTMTLKSVTIK